MTHVSFVVRLWLEPHHGVDPEWRFHVRHVQSDAEAYGRRLSDLLAFLEREAHVPAPSLSAGLPEPGAPQSTPTISEG